MPGNSQRRGATTKGRGNTAGSGGRIRRSLEGKGPTPKAEDRPYHKAYKAKQAAQRKQPQRAQRTSSGRGKPGLDWVIGRNPVYEALVAGVPIRGVYVAEGIERDDRMRDILTFAAERGLPLLQATRPELDRLTGGGVHQGVALQLPPYDYADPSDLIATALDATAPLVVALDGITDPHNFGAIVRSAAAFGAQGVLITERRSASLTAAAWKASAGAAARIRVGMAGNLNRGLEQFGKAGFTIVGLAAEGSLPIADVPDLDGPVLLVVGSEGDGLARLVREHCDHLASIPIASEVESLNASVAAAVALYEIGRHRG